MYGLKKRIFFALVVGGVFSALLVTPFDVLAQQQSQPKSPEQQVPANPAPPPAPEQPLPYSHKTHLALGLQCQFCHTNPAQGPGQGRMMTFPATSTCMSCHNTIAKDKPAIMKLAQFAKSGEPVPWVRVYTVLPGVQWSHATHLQAGMKCQTCHGNVAQMSTMTTATSVTSMATCINCHQINNAKTACITCHAWPSSVPSQ